MPVSVGDKLGPYEILARIGAGGMGEVWKARDTRVDREVAVKISAAQFSDRFEREARSIAALNHPNICTLYDVGPNYLVMELIEGPTLAERISQGPIPLDEALTIAKQMADAIEAAHEKGVIHRDLKPANIKLRHDGSVKVLDFGLAKSAIDSGELTPDSPTMLSMAGTIVGTAGYMSPEQARGKTVDKRADIWAFGVILYELVTGKRLFDGDTVSDVLAEVLKSEPDLSAVPVRLRRLIASCLEKDPKNRLRDIGDWARLLEEDRAPAALVRRPKGALIAIVAVVALVAIAVSVLGWWTWQHRASSAAVPAVMLDMLPPPDQGFALGRSAAISPDGRYIAFRTQSNRLAIRDLASNTFRPLMGSATAPYPFWSPDSRTIAYFDGTQLRRQDMTGWPSAVVSDNLLPQRRGGTWSPSGDLILFSASGQVFRVGAAGGTPAVVLRPDNASGETEADWPVFLPDGRHFLYLATSATPTLWVADLRTGQRTRLVSSDSYGLYVSGYLLFVRGGFLMAQAFNPATLQLSGDAVPLAEGVTGVPFTGEASLGASKTGVLAYLAGGNGGRVQLTWFDRSGKSLGTLGDPLIPNDWAVISPDGATVAFSKVDPTNAQNADVWLFNVARGTASRLTVGPRQRLEPVWSPDGLSLAYAFSAGARAQYTVIRALAVNREEEMPRPDPTARMMPEDWSGDGRYLVERLIAGPNQDDLWVQPLFGNRTPVPFAQGPYTERNSKVSSDSRWLAYTSSETGRSQVYVQSFPTPGHKVQISVDGGDRAVWSRDGKELYFIAPDGKLMAVPVKSGAALEAGQPKALFEPGIPMTDFAFNNRFDVSKDGRFLIPVELKETHTRPLTVVPNWTALLKR